MTKRFKISELCHIALMTAFIAVCGFISVPFFAVPFTLQLFGVYFSLFLLGGRRGSIAVLLYVLLGIVGLPVFSGFTGGVGRLLDAGGGYIFGFVIIAVIFWLLEHVFGGGKRHRAIFSSICLIVLYTIGSVWYALVYLGSIAYIWAALLATCLPFIVFDIIKICLAWLLSDRLSRYFKV